MVARSRRGRLRRQSTRDKLMERLEIENPALFAELAELRRYNPQAYRKRFLEIGLIEDRGKKVVVEDDED
jgi:hypothetical protein